MCSPTRASILTGRYPQRFGAIFDGALSGTKQRTRGLPLTAVTLAEVLATADVPGGIVNLLTGFVDELLPHMAGHMDVNALLLCTDDEESRRQAEELGAENVKRVVVREDAPLEEDPYEILAFQEIKTTWHPVGV